MKIETTITVINGSHYIRVPANMTKYFKLPEIKENGICNIEDKGQNKAELTFNKG